MPKQPGIYSYCPKSGAGFTPVEVVTYRDRLMAKLPDGDDFELHPIEDLDGEWLTLEGYEEDEARRALQADQPYFVLIRGPGTEKMTQKDRDSFERAFRDAFDSVCNQCKWPASAVVHAWWDGGEDVLDPRAGGPGFFPELHDLAIARMAVKPPQGAHFYCFVNFDAPENRVQPL